MIKTASIVLGILSLIFTLLPLFKYGAWWIRVLDFPRLQIIVVSVIALTLTFYIKSPDVYDRIMTVCMAACIIYQSVRIFPYTPFAKVQVLKSTKMSDPLVQIGILVTNVLMTNKNSEKCLKVIYEMNPDVILAVETNPWWQSALKILEKTYPYTVQVPLANTYGMLFYSKLKLINPEVKYIIESDVPSIHTCIELKSGDKIMFHGLHPKPPAPQESKTSTPRDAELIIVGKSCKASNMPVIIAGDLNDVAWSHTTHLFQRIGALLDPRIGRGMFSTFNAKYSLLRWPLDHVFHSRDFRLITLKRLADIGSDHFPIYVKLNFEPEKKQEHEKPQATERDKKDAKEKLEAHNENVSK